MSLTAKEFEALSHEVFADERSVRSSFRIIARLLLCKYFKDTKVFSQDFGSLLKRFEDSDLNFLPNPPTQEDAFYTFLCKEFLNYSEEPPAARSDLLLDIGDDIRSIHMNLHSLRESHKLIESRLDSSAALDDDILEDRLHRYYVKKNQTALEEIYQFLADEGRIDDHIKSRVVKSFSNSFLSSFTGSPYAFRLRPANFKYRKPQLLDNKRFEELSIKEFRDLKAEFPSPDTRDYIVDYIQSHSVVNRCRAEIENSLVLVGRRNMLEEALEHFSSGRFFSFNTTILILLEGIFEDACKQLSGINTNLNRSGLAAKIELVIEGSNLLPEHLVEYYQFYLPHLRNGFAHAKPVNIDPEVLACMLLMDLHHLLELVNSDKIRLNRKVKLINLLQENLSLGKSDYPTLFQIQIYSDIDLSSLTEIREKELSSEALLEEPGFWSFIDVLLAEKDESLTIGVTKILEVLKKKSGIGIEAKERLRNISKPVLNAARFNERLFEDYIMQIVAENTEFKV